MMPLLGPRSKTALQSVACSFNSSVTKGQTGRLMAFNEGCSSSSNNVLMGNEIGRRSLSTSTPLLRNKPARRPKDPLENAPNARRHPLPTGETFIVRPPPSVASYRYEANSVGNISPEALPPLRPKSFKANEAHKILNQNEISEIQKLRNSDPVKYSPLQLARQFGCSPTYVRIVAPATRSRLNEHIREIEARRAGWGENKTLQRELRRERRSLW